MKVWIEHMTNPFVLSGFGILIIATVLLGKKKIRNKFLERSIFLIVFLVFVSEVIGVIQVLVKIPERQHVLQQSYGSNSPNISNAKKVKISYSSMPAPSLGTDANQKLDSAKSLDQTSKKSTTLQKTFGAQSPNISVSDSVNISY